MKRLKKPTSALLIAIMLISNSKELVASALENNTKQIVKESRISTISPEKAKNEINEQNIFYNKQNTDLDRPCVTNISKSVVSLGNSYYANISLSVKAQKGSTVYINLGGQTESVYINDSQSFTFYIETMSKDITVELYSVNDKGEQSDSVYVNITSGGDSIINNGNPPKTNTIPTINTEDTTINLNSQFDPLENVSATDNEDGDLTDKIIITKNTVDTTKVGNYEVTYQVTDSDDNTTIKERKIKVETNKEPDIKDEEEVSKPTVPPQDEVKFSDISGHWAEAQIKDFTNNGYLSGYPDGTFRPQNNITRAEFAKTLNKVFGLTTKSGKVFSDTKNHWAKDEIDIAVTNGICQGTSTTTFDPESPITREQAAKMIANYKKINDVNHNKINSYYDGSETSSWAIDAVEAVLEAGYMSGYNNNTFRPKNNITRAESVAMLSRVL